MLMVIMAKKDLWGATQGIMRKNRQKGGKTESVAHLCDRCHTGTGYLLWRLKLGQGPNKKLARIEQSLSWEKRTQGGQHLAIMVKKRSNLGLVSLARCVTATVTPVLNCLMMWQKWRDMSGGHIPSSYVLGIGQNGARGTKICIFVSTSSLSRPCA